MTTFDAEILNLVNEISDPQIRMEVIRTLKYLYYQWEAGEIRDEEFRKALEEIVLGVLEEINPDAPEEELQEQAKEFAERLFRKARLQTMFRRMRMRF